MNTLFLSSHHQYTLILSLSLSLSLSLFLTHTHTPTHTHARGASQVGATVGTFLCVFETMMRVARYANNTMAGGCIYIYMCV
jgi:hypothetical protein